MVVSERGESLSPKNAPQIMEAAVIPGSKPRPAPIPMMARPTVPIVPHEVPVVSDVTEHRIRLVTRNRLGEMIWRPT